MHIKHHHKTLCSRRDAGVALITTLLLLFLMSSLLVGFCILLISNQQLAGANNDDTLAFYGAEAGMEQLTANLGNLFDKTYSPTETQINNLSTSPPAPTIPGISFVDGSGNPGYTVVPTNITKYDKNGNPVPPTSTVKIGPYAGLTAFVTEYALTVHARTAAGREVELTRTTQTVGIPAFSFGIFCGMDCSFFAGPTFTFGGRTHTNGSLFLASQSTLTLDDKTDAYGDIIRKELSNGFKTSGTYDGTVQISTNPGTDPTTCIGCRALAMTEGSWDPTVPGPISTWPTVSTGSPTGTPLSGYNHNLINGLGSLDPTHSTGAKQLNLAVAILGSGATQTVDLNRRPVIGEPRTVTAERYFDGASLRILLSDDPTDITNLPCVSAGAPLNLGLMATTFGAWSTSTDATLKTLAANLAANKVVPLPLATSGATGAAYTPADGYWLPAGYPVIKGFIKIEEQTTYGDATGCGSWTDVTAEILGFGYVGRNINPVPQSFDGSNLNPQWPAKDATHMEPSAFPAIPNLAGLAATQLGPQNASKGAPTPALNPGTFASPTIFSVINTPGAVAPAGTCPDPHPNAIIRLERVRDNPSSVYYNSGTYAAPGKHSAGNPYFTSTVEEVCGWDTSVVPPALPTLRSSQGTMPAVNPNTGVKWAPTGADFWPNVLFDTREGELRESPMSAANLPTLNGAMSYIEIDANNLASWFSGTLGGIATTGQNTKDKNNSSNNFVVYISDRRGNYADTKVQTITKWPPLSFTSNETGEYGWSDIVNPGDAKNGCPDNTLNAGEDENLGTPDKGLFYVYGASQNYLHAAGTALGTLNNGQLGIFSGLTTAGSALTKNDNCTSIPPYSLSTASGDNLWPMLVATNQNAPRENPPLFFRRAIKIVNGNLLTALGVCPSGNNCGLAISTENPVYIQGDFNANSDGKGIGTSTTTYVASSVSADAVTLLSNYWNDVNSFSTPYSLGNRKAITTNYRTAVLAGVSGVFPLPGGTPSTQAPKDFGTDGGVHNFLRFLEDWTNQTLNYRGSIVQMFYSRQANATYKCCGTVYNPPTRGYNFDTDFSDPLKLPPRTPLFRDVNTTGWTRVMLPSQ